MNKSPKLVVLVLHWKGLDNTRQCLESLKASQYANQHILVVDNGSSDRDDQTLRQQFAGRDDIEVLRLDKNHGFAGGCNRGMSHAIKGGADFIWLLNNDALAKPETTSILMQMALANPDAAALGAAIIEGHGPDRKPAGLGSIDFDRAKTYLRALEGRVDPLDGRPIECDWLSGCNLLLRVSALQKSGLFDERYFLYFEDVELCLRLTNHGYKCLLVPQAVIEHEGNASTQGGLKLWRSYYHTRNRLLFFSENTPRQKWLSAKSHIAGHLLKHCFSLPLRGKAGRARLRAEYLGLRDFNKAIFGEATCLQWCQDLKI